MRMPRSRSTVRRIMLAVAATALILGYLRRPHPVRTRMYPADAASPVGRFEIAQEWSDGRVRCFDAVLRPDGSMAGVGGETWPRRRRRYGPVLRVEWSDAPRVTTSTTEW